MGLGIEYTGDLTLQVDVPGANAHHVTVESCVRTAVAVSIPTNVWYSYQVYDGKDKDGKDVYHEEGKLLPVKYISSAFYNCNKLQSITIPNSVVQIGGSAFYGCSQLRSVTIPSSVTDVGVGAFENCGNIAEVRIESLASWCRITFEPSLYEGIESYGGNNPLCLDDGGVGVELYVNNVPVNGRLHIPEEVEFISRYCFFGWSNLVEVTMSDSVRGIGGTAFGRCENLKGVIIGDGVENVGPGAFSWCRNLESVTIGKNVKEIGEDAFMAGVALSEITIPGNVAHIGDYAFETCCTLRKLRLSEGVKSIGRDAFCLCESLEDVSIPNSVTNLGDEVFRECTSLKSVSVGDGVDNIPGMAFWRCEALTDVSLGRNVTNIGEIAFGYCTELASITIPGVRSIEYGAFHDTKLSRVDFGDELTYIGEYAFQSCNELTDVTIGRNVSFVGEYSFSWCENLTYVNFSLSKVSNIENGTLGGCPNLEYVSFGSSVTNICDNAITGCNHLYYIDFDGNAPYVGASAFSLESPPPYYWDEDYDGCTVRVSPLSTGWGVEIPGVWHGMRIEYLTLSASAVSNAIDNAGYVDGARIKEAVGGSADEYRDFLAWAEAVKAVDPNVGGAAEVAGMAKVRECRTAWLSFALGSEVLLEEPQEGDLVIEDVEMGEDGGFKAVFSLDGVEIDSGALESRLKTVFSVEATSSLDGTFSSDNVEFSLSPTGHGGVTATVMPKGSPRSFFLRVRMK